MNTSMPPIPQFPEAAIVKIPAKHLVGLSVRTSMETAMEDCTALWEQFAPWMWQVHGVENGNYACPSYGLSTDTDMQSGQFTYWATIEVQSHFADPAQWPAGFAAITLAAGPYVGTGLTSLSAMTEAYTYLYGPWTESQQNHALDFAGDCVEYYDERYLKHDSVDLYVPLRAK